MPTLTDLAIQADGRLIAAGNAGCKDPHPLFVASSECRSQAGTMRTSGIGTMNLPPRSRNSVSRSRNSSRKCHGSAR